MMGATDRIGQEPEYEAPALREGFGAVIEQYQEKLAALPEAIAAVDEAVQALKSGVNIGGQYGGQVFREPHISERDCARSLLISAWRYAYARLKIETVTSARDRDQFKTWIENPDPFTYENVVAKFGPYVADPRFNILRGLAEAFITLDPAFKSHSKVKIGVKGLPKRIVISGCSDYYSSYGWKRVGDAMNALQVYRNQPRIEFKDLRSLHEEARRNGEADWPGGRLKLFQNGNAHLFFDMDGLRDINRALAEFYGDVLPDAPEDAPKKRAGTNVSANLAYYPTPRAVIEAVMGHISTNGRRMMLEPSCGDGRILDYFREKHPEINCTGIEVDAGRAMQARAKGHAVRCTNFLEVAPDPRFDLIIMNPPFCGAHCHKHLDHAQKFVAPGGVLACILPASANDDGRFPTRGWADGHWRDLPLASFRESGTNVCTGYVILTAPNQQRRAS